MERSVVSVRLRGEVDQKKPLLFGAGRRVASIALQLADAGHLFISLLRMLAKRLEKRAYDMYLPLTNAA